MIYLLLAALAYLHPGANRTNSAREIASSIAKTVESARESIFGDAITDEAVMLETAHRESRFLVSAVGDGGRSLGPFQLQNADTRAFDIDYAVRVAYDRLRISALRCPDAPLAIYLGGSCTNRGARRISELRMREAKTLVENAIATESALR